MKRSISKITSFKVHWFLWENMDSAHSYPLLVFQCVVFAHGVLLRENDTGQQQELCVKHSFSCSCYLQIQQNILLGMTHFYPTKKPIINQMGIKVWEQKQVHHWNSYQELWTALLKVIKFTVHISQTLVDLIQLCLNVLVLLMVFVKQMLVFLSLFIINNGRELAVKTNFSFRMVHYILHKYLLCTFIFKLECLQWDVTGKVHP